MKKIFLLLAFVLFEIHYAKSQDTLCLTAKEYNDLLVASNCTELFKADSVLIWDREKEIKLQSEYIKGQGSQIANCETQLKKTKRKLLGYKFLSGFFAIFGTISTTYFIIH